MNFESWAKKWEVSILQLWLLFALLLIGSRQLSFTTDEPSHLAAGYAYLSQGQAGLWTIPLRGHPLLVDIWEALPLYIGAPHIPVETLPGWGEHKTSYVEAFIHAVGPLARSEVASRAQASLLTILLAATIWRWATDMWEKPSGGLIALVWLTFDPILLAHGRLATNDAGMTTMGTLFLFLIWRWARRPNWKTALLAGFVGGLALLSKGSGVLWLAAGGIIMLWQVWRNRSKPSHQLLQSLATGTLAFLILWAMYGFEVGPLPHLPFPVPAATHWYGVFYHANASTEFRVFALGQIKEGHWWWYFPVAFLIKNPLPLLLGTLASIYFILSKPTYRQQLHNLILFPTLYLIIAISQGPNIGYRHLLPLHPFLYLLLTGTTIRLWYSPVLKYLVRAALFTAMLCYAISAALTYPYEIGYFNQLVGGSQNGWRYLASSNTDFRQGWRALQAWQAKYGIDFYALGFKYKYLGPEDYGIDYQPLISTHDDYRLILPLYLYPTPGDYVIRAHTLSMYLDNYAWFRYRKPDAVIANSLYYYHVPHPIEPSWLAQCSVPAAPLLDEKAISEGFQTFTPREITFNCTQTWLYPYGGQTTGWYAFHEQALRPGNLRQHLYLRDAIPQNSFAAQKIAQVKQSFRYWEYHETPAFALYEWRPHENHVPVPQQFLSYPAPAAMAPQTLQNRPPTHTPLQLDGPLQLLGASFSISGEQLEAETWWQVTASPISRPFSLMAHLLTAEGQPLDVNDGLGIEPTALLRGDIIVQYHHFPIPALPDEAWLRTGAYWLDNADLPRWRVTETENSDAIFIPVNLSN